MRKLFLLVVIVMAAITASAQEGIYLGGGISLWRNNDVDKTSFSIMGHRTKRILRIERKEYQTY